MNGIATFTYLEPSADGEFVPGKQDGQFSVWNKNQVVVLIILCLSIFAITISSFLLKRGSYTHSEYNTTDNGTVRQAFIHNEYNPVCLEVLLIYSRQSEEFLKLIEELTTVLEKHTVKVWDPLSSRNEEDVFMNPIAWFEYIANKPNIKYILVANEEGLLREKAWINGSEYQLKKRHCLDDIFLYALSSIYNSPELVFNYSRLFTISFESKLQYLNIVPCRTYQLPTQYDQFLYDLTH